MGKTFVLNEGWQMLCFICVHGRDVTFSWSSLAGNCYSIIRCSPAGLVRTAARACHGSLPLSVIQFSSAHCGKRSRHISACAHIRTDLQSLTQTFNRRCNYLHEKTADKQRFFLRITCSLVRTIHT